MATKYKVTCASCSFEDRIERIEAVYRRMERHQEETGDEHVFEFYRLE